MSVLNGLGDLVENQGLSGIPRWGEGSAVADRPDRQQPANESTNWLGLPDGPSATTTLAMDPRRPIDGSGMGEDLLQSILRGPAPDSGNAPATSPPQTVTPNGPAGAVDTLFGGLF